MSRRRRLVSLLACLLALLVVMPISAQSGRIEYAVGPGPYQVSTSGLIVTATYSDCLANNSYRVPFSVEIVSLVAASRVQLLFRNLEGVDLRPTVAPSVIDLVANQRQSVSGFIDFSVPGAKVPGTRVQGAFRLYLDPPPQSGLDVDAGIVVRVNCVDEVQPTSTPAPPATATSPAAPTTQPPATATAVAPTTQPGQPTATRAASTPVVPAASATRPAPTNTPRPTNTATRVAPTPTRTRDSFIGGELMTATPKPGDKGEDKNNDHENQPSSPPPGASVARTPVETPVRTPFDPAATPSLQTAPRTAIVPALLPTTGGLTDGFGLALQASGALLAIAGVAWYRFRKR